MTIAQGVPHRRPYDYARLLSSFPAASSTKTENGAPEEWDAAVYVRNIPPHGHRTKAKFRRYLWKNCGLRDFWVTEVNVKNRQQDGRLAMVVNFPSSEEALLAKYRITCISFKGSTLRTSFMNRRTGSTAEESRQESDIALADTDATPSPILPAVPRRTPKRDSLSERDSGSSMPKHELYVGHLAGTTTLEQLQRLFQYAPGFKSVRLGKVLGPGKLPHYAFVEFETPVDAEEALELTNNFKLENGRRLKVQFAGKRTTSGDVEN